MLMNADLYQRLNCEIMMLEKARKEYTSRLEQLQDCKGSFLRRTKPGKGKYYYYSVKVDIATRFQSGSENMLPTPCPSA